MNLIGTSPVAPLYIMQVIMKSNNQDLFLVKPLRK